MKRNIKRLTTMVIAGMVTVVPMSALAQENNTVEAEKLTEATAVKEEEKQAESKYIANEATVVEVTETENGVEALVKTEKDQYRLNLPKSMLVIDQKEAKIGSIENITKDSKIVYYTTETTPMGMSYPGYLTPEFVVANTEERAHFVGSVDENFLSNDGNVKFNMNEETPIIPANGTKIKLYPENIVGKDIVAVYTIATMSIPAQTSPELVVVLPEEETTVNPEDKEKEGEFVAPTYTNKDGIEMTGFAAVAQNKGYEVKWDAKNFVATAEKDGNKIEAFVNRQSIAINGKELKMIVPMETVEGRLYIESTMFDTMFPAE